jgi:hypothetical protein
VKKAKSKNEKLTPKEKKGTTNEQKEYKSNSKMIRKS